MKKFKNLEECQKAAFDYCIAVGVDPMRISFTKDGAYVQNEGSETYVKEFIIEK